MEQIVYEEKSAAFESLIFFALGTLFLLLLLLELDGMRLGNHPAPWWVYFVLSAFFFFLAAGFSSFAVRCTSTMIVAGYPVYRVKIPCENVIDARVEDIGLRKLGGYGIRLFRYDGKKALAVVRSSKGIVLLTLRDFRYPYVAISVRAPDIFIGHIHNRVQED
jgi:uncharacterized membrane protein YdcZ (DUF606 family)